MDAFDQIGTWVRAGAPWLLAAGAALVAVCFVVFNTLRIALYVPQLITCLRDQHGCPTVNLWTWGSWIVANLSTGLYMWIFQGDLWGLALNLGNSAMCLATVGVTLAKRHAHARSTRVHPSHPSTPSATPSRADSTRLRPFLHQQPHPGDRSWM